MHAEDRLRAVIVWFWSKFEENTAFYMEKKINTSVIHFYKNNDVI